MNYIIIVGVGPLERFIRRWLHNAVRERAVCVCVCVEEEEQRGFSVDDCIFLPKGASL